MVIIDHLPKYNNVQVLINHVTMYYNDKNLLKYYNGNHRPPT